MHTHPVITITSSRINKANRAPRISIGKVFIADLANGLLSFGHIVSVCVVICCLAVGASYPELDRVVMSQVFMILIVLVTLSVMSFVLIGHGCCCIVVTVVLMILNIFATDIVSAHKAFKYLSTLSSHFSTLLPQPIVFNLDKM